MWNSKKKKPKVHLDSPNIQIFGERTTFSGWYAGSGTIKDIKWNGFDVESFETPTRKDAAEEHPHHNVISGFHFEAETSEFSGTSEITIAITDSKGNSDSFQFQLKENPSWLIKKEKLKRIPKILKSIENSEKTDTLYDFLDQPLKELAGVVPSTATSSHPYTDEMWKMIDEVNEDGWILDCGAGYRETHKKNLIHFEIEPYVSTDVRGVCEALPFKDESFDLVLSLVVLEHVKDPAKAVREMERVLKPGGKIWIDAAFMQPFHGYPSHYFNMTRHGLRSLLPYNVQAIEEFVPKYGSPIWSLTWIVERYAQGLAEDTRKEFLELKLRDLICHPEKLLNENWVTSLSPDASQALAATNTYIGVKR
ncbi:methyltransferase domain-containing protein [Pelagicoccus sp. SDUM812005]|uniref:class I SAM-dependent methyltransferase n=1 Tax=Pelagicoccus sp. SDUM812005 TaxID=3041257 RepID=UPI00280D0476|nr:methyltransferase domain-containing protein [Pelagicoccus sp. SDUM812005]MDQ8182367.1 methyltransferase domain-containing protein [Pelagicoccus sp. SDUM812005]